MSHVQEVREIGPGRTRWKATGPLGTTVSWNAVETARVPGRLLAWRSEPGSQIDNAGIVRFEPVGDGATRVDVRLSYTGIPVTKLIPCVWIIGVLPNHLPACLDPLYGSLTEGAFRPYHLRPPRGQTTQVLVRPSRRITRTQLAARRPPAAAKESVPGEGEGGIRCNRALVFVSGPCEIRTPV
ncbi:MAG: hypothetical protein ACREK7_02895 [Gemmatimonadota bacterium]